MIFSKQLLISNCCFDVEGAFRTGILQEAINVEYKWIFWRFLTLSRMRLRVILAKTEFCGAGKEWKRVTDWVPYIHT